MQVGGGNLTNPLFGYVPQHVEIKVGEIVNWYVKPGVPAYTVTFVFDNNVPMHKINQRSITYSGGLSGIVDAGVDADN